MNLKKIKAVGLLALCFLSINVTPMGISSAIASKGYTWDRIYYTDASYSTYAGEAITGCDGKTVLEGQMTAYVVTLGRMPCY